MADLKGTMVWGRAARPLAMLVIATVPQVADAQQACPLTRAWTAGGSLVVVPTTASWRGADGVALGESAATLGTNEHGKVVAKDSTLAGVRFTVAGGVTPISRPPGTRAFIYPRAMARGGGAHTVLWSEPDFDAGARYGVGAHDLRVARLSARGWEDVRTIGRVELDVAITRQAGSDLVTVGPRTYLGFPARPMGSPRAVLALAEEHEGRWTVGLHDFGTWSVGSVALTADRGRPAVLFAAHLTSTRLQPGDPSGFAPLHVSRFDGRAWSPLVTVADRGPVPRSQPQLLPDGEDLVAAWIDAGDPPVLRWRAISPTGVLGPVQELEGGRMLVSGQGELRSLVSVLMPDGTGRALRLRRDGYDEVGRFPAGVGMSVVLVGAPSRPVALVAEVDSSGGTVRGMPLSAYHLNCYATP